MIQHRKPLVLIPQFFGCLVFDRRTSRYMPFDQDATTLFQKLSKQSISELLESERNLSPGIIDFCKHFYGEGYFDINGRLDAELLELTPPKDHLAGPLAVHLEIIGACNLTCSHCFAGTLPRNQNPLQLIEMEALFNDLAAMGSFRLGLTGGEPLMRNDLFEILDAATDRGLHPCLTTNGLLIDERIAIALGRRELIWLNVSLDGATVATNDRIRGTGTFDQVVEKLKILRQHSRFTIAFTLTSLNVSEAQDCARLAHDLGAHTAVFRPLYPVGVAAKNLHLMPEFADYVAALQSLGEIELGDDIHPIDPFSPQARELKRSRVTLNNGCGAANTIASISVQGDVNPCSFLGPAFNTANIRDRSFREIWSRGNQFVSLRQMSKPAECGDCCDEFAGGCRARALVMAGDANAPDPWHTQWAAGRSALHPLVNLEVQRGD